MSEIAYQLYKDTQKLIEIYTLYNCISKPTDSFGLKKHKKTIEVLEFAYPDFKRRYEEEMGGKK